MRGGVAAAAPLGPARPRRRRRHAAHPPDHVHYGDERVAIDIKPSHGVDALYAPRRTRARPDARRRRRDAGADVRFGVTVTDVRRDATAG